MVIQNIFKYFKNIINYNYNNNNNNDQQQLYNNNNNKDNNNNYQQILLQQQQYDIDNNYYSFFNQSQQVIDTIPQMLVEDQQQHQYINNIYAQFNNNNQQQDINNNNNNNNNSLNQKENNNNNNNQKQQIEQDKNNNNNINQQQKDNNNNKNQKQQQQLLQQQQPLMKPILPEHVGLKTLVLDMDETLIHASRDPIINPDFITSVQHLDKDGINIISTYYVSKRPFVEEFLNFINGKFEIVVFTAGTESYANQILDKLDVNKVIHHRLFRDSCSYIGKSHIKDLSRLGRDLKDIIIIDNTPKAYSLQPDNAIPIVSWYDDKNDLALDKIKPLLNALTKVDDVKPIFDHSTGRIINKQVIYYNSIRSNNNNNDNSSSRRKRICNNKLKTTTTRGAVNSNKKSVSLSNNNSNNNSKKRNR